VALILGASPLRDALEALARDARLVFFAGLPGTGKSLLIHQLAQLAHGRGRAIHLLQWDVARPVFEASAPGRRYPQERGVTHGVVRLAVGRWARAAIHAWHARHAGEGHILIGETPFVGHRLIELARPEPDAAEAALAAEWTRFVIPVPSRELRRHLEAERGRRAHAPLHPREREDAPPEVLESLWRELVDVAASLGIRPPAPPESRRDADRRSPPAPGHDATRRSPPGEAGPEGSTRAAAPYDPAVYRAVYERLLVHRHAQALAMEARLPADRLSPYDLGVPASDLAPSEDEAGAFILEVEARGGGAEAVRRAIEGWYRPA
jgi:hypothetical protein